MALPASVGAQPAAAETSPVEVTPPKLVQATEPVYPESKKSSGEAASVGLLLTIDESGHVSDGTVTESSGPEFDAAALAAARDLVFEPATRNGKPTAARVPFRYDFALAPAASEPPVAAATPTSQATVTPSAPASPTPVPPDEELDIAVAGEKPPREPTQRTLTGEEITKIPGTNGDALRSLTNMPGVARPGGLDGLLIVRGSSPNDTQIFVDGTSVPLIYHLGGLSSVVPSEILERIDFYPGNFGPQYGRGMGGIVDVGVRSPKKDRFHGLLQFDSIDGRFLAEGPISDSTRVLIAGRRSWLDAWLGPALRSSGVGVTVAPVYYDYQAMVEHDVSKKTQLRVFAFGGDDRTELTLNAPSSSDPAQGGSALSRESFWRVQGRIDTRPSDSLRWTSTISVGHGSERQSIGDMFVDVNQVTVEGRSDVRAKLAPELTAMGGIDVVDDIFDAKVRLPPVEFGSDENQGPLFGRPVRTLKASGSVLRPAAYAMLEVTPLAGLKLLPGVRADYDADTRDWTFDPRIGVRYDVHAGYPRTTLKGGAGIFHQPPQPYESIEPFGTPSVESNTAHHYSVGFEQEFLPPLELSVEGFYKNLDNLVVSNPSANANAAGQSYVNTGTGRTYGAELLLRYKPTGPLFGWVAYTLSRSERRDAAGEEKYLFEYDQTHILTALASYKLGRGWQVGARFRYVSGKPYTPNLGGVMDYDAGVYSPIASPHKYSSRLPAFQQLDVRVDKTWTFRSWSLAFYVDVQNTYNHKNIEAQGDNYDYSKTTPVYGLPILPIVGLRGEL
jgi:TonB family protein